VPDVHIQTPNLGIFSHPQSLFDRFFAFFPVFSKKMANDIDVGPTPTGLMLITRIQPI
jgi:hypothetical protein